MSNSVLQNCPDCGRVLYFTHNETTLIQCACGTTVHRKDGIVAAKPVYTVTHPSDLIQPGTEGNWNGKTFLVLGRVRAWMEEFVFNYWTIKWDDDSISYLGEGYGLFAIYLRIFPDRILTTSLLDDVKVNAHRDLFKDEAFILERKYQCYKWELEGEAWLPLAPSSFRSFEFAAVNSRRIEAIEVSKNLVFSFQVHYASLGELQLQNTRNIPLPVKILSCNHCQKENILKGFPFSQSYACIHCGTKYALEQGINFKQVGQRNSTEEGPAISLNSVGIINGVSYELIGFAQKEEVNQYRSQWKEYTLYNQHEGFAFLSEYNGHWIFLKEKGAAPVLEKEHHTSFTFLDERFELYNSYNYEIINAKGEFPYNAFNDQEKKAKEFISPPEVWIQEKSGREGITWYLGEHISAKEITAAFGDNAILPWKTGVGAIEPKGYVSIDKIIKMGFVSVLILILVHVLTSYTHRDQLISENTYDFTDTADTVAYIKKGIVLDKWRSNLEFEIYANVSNSWCEVSATLVDVVKGTEYSFEKGVEYYFGYTDGEHWSEGSVKETAYLNEIPAGNYDLIIRGLRESKYQLSSTGNTLVSNPNLRSFSIIIWYDTTNHRNLIFCLIPLVLWPLFHFFIIRRNERRRWYNSPFSPYTYSNED